MCVLHFLTRAPHFPHFPHTQALAEIVQGLCVINSMAASAAGIVATPSHPHTPGLPGLGSTPSGSGTFLQGGTCGTFLTGRLPGSLTNTQGSGFGDMGSTGQRLDWLTVSVCGGIMTFAGRVTLTLTLERHMRQVADPALSVLLTTLALPTLTLPTPFPTPFLQPKARDLSVNLMPHSVQVAQANLYPNLNLNSNSNDAGYGASPTPQTPHTPLGVRGGAPMPLIIPGTPSGAGAGTEAGHASVTKASAAAAAAVTAGRAMWCNVTSLNLSDNPIGIGGAKV